MVAFGATAFVRHAFVDREIENPEPGLNSRIIGSIDAGNPVVLDDEELRAQNTKGGLDSSFAARLFNYGEPSLWLGDTYQKMLSAALRGLTDEELCQALGAKLPTIKKQWATIFSHVAAVKPDLLPDVNDDRRIRGRQKRHHLLAYLRHHPEALRPLLISRKAQGQ